MSGSEAEVRESCALFKGLTDLKEMGFFLLWLVALDRLLEASSTIRAWIQSQSWQDRAAKAGRRNCHTARLKAMIGRAREDGTPTRNEADSGTELGAKTQGGAGETREERKRMREG